MEEYLLQAERLVREYDWLGAVESYEKVLNLLPEDSFLRKAEAYELLGYALCRFSFQAQSNDEFRQRLRQAISNYEKAKGFFQKLNDRKSNGKALRCDAMITYVGHWLALEVSEKKSMLDECWKLTKDCLRAFEAAGEKWEYGRTYNQLSSAAIFMFTREPDFKSREKVIRDAVEYGEKAIQCLSGCGDPPELARACAKTVVCLAVFGYYFLDVDEREKYREKGLSYWAKAKELSEEVAMTEFLYPVFGGQPFFGLEGTDEAIANYEKALEYGKKTKDKFTIGCALDWLTYHTAGWKTGTTEDPDKKAQLIEKATQYAEEATRQFSTISYVSPRGDNVWLGAIDLQRQIWLVGSETDLKKKRDLLEEAGQILTSVRKRGEETGYPEITFYVYFNEANFLLSLAQSKTDLAEKKRRLEEALSDCNESTKIAEQLEPFLYWNRGAMRMTLSLIKSELANLAEEPETRQTLLQEAINDKENAIAFLVKELTFLEKKGSATSLYATVGGQQYAYGNLLVQLYDQTKNKDLLRKAVETYKQAIEYFQKLDLTTHIAEANWRKAQVYDRLGELVSASQSFENARANYAFAFEKIPQLRDFYRDQSVYMHTWSQIEKGKHHHERQEYGLAEEHFEKASRLYEQSKRWNYLSQNYAAWAQTDRAEELSRRESSEEARLAFEKAADLFEETRKSLENQLEKIDESEEKQMAKDMLKATFLRHQYCFARVAVEEAKILDKKGDHFSSSEKYQSAAETLTKIGESVESERDKREINLIATLSQAWAKMTLAEAEEDPSPYAEASQLFEKAKELSSNEKTKTLALGHSRFCRALEAGMRFTDTGDENLHTTAIQHLESAGRYYVKAGYQSASEYAKATDLLLEAYSDINRAKKEPDPEKKARLLAVAEKVLQSSAGYFLKAEHPEKREQTLRLLERVKEERELTQSLNEVLHTPSIVSATAVFATLAPGQEVSVGLEKFENANIQANIITRQKHLKVGENLDLEIELVNAGKSSAQLIKISELAPSGFEIVKSPESYRVEDSFLNMRGKQIGPLKTEDIKVTLRPKIKGDFSLKPTVLYLDESGRYKSHEPQPVSITVKELGIKGWLKGER